MEATFSPEQSLGRQNSTSIVELIKEKLADWWSMLMVGHAVEKPEKPKLGNYSSLFAGSLKEAPIVKAAKEKTLGHKDYTSQITNH